MERPTVGEFWDRQKIIEIFEIPDEKNFVRSVERFLSACGYEFSKNNKRGKNMGWTFTHVPPEDSEDYIKEFCYRELKMDVRKNALLFGAIVFLIFTRKDFYNMPLKLKTIEINEILKACYSEPKISLALKDFSISCRSMVVEDKSQDNVWLTLKTSGNGRERRKINWNDEKDVKLKEDYDNYINSLINSNEQKFGEGRRWDGVHLAAWNKFGVYFHIPKEYIVNGCADYSKLTELSLLMSNFI